MTAIDDPDANDVALAASGDRAAFERIYHRNGARLHALARRMVGADLADDALQDVFLSAWRQLSQFRGEARFSTWLHRVALSVLLRQAANARRIAARMSASDPDALHARVPSGDAHLDVNTALSRLSEEVRAVVVLHDMEGYAHAEIADTLGISVSASKMRLLRARLQLRELLLS